MVAASGGGLWFGGGEAGGVSASFAQAEDATHPPEDTGMESGQNIRCDVMLAGLQLYGCVESSCRTTPVLLVLGGYGS